jgi:hypothetical protein
MSFFNKRKDRADQNKQNAVKPWAPTNPRLASNLPLSSLKSEESVTLPITQPHNILRTNSVGSKNCRYEFDAQDGAKGTIHVSGGVFKVKHVVWE